MAATFIRYLYEVLVGSETQDVTPRTALQRLFRTLRRVSQEQQVASWFRSSSDQLLGRSENKKGRLLLLLTFAYCLFDDIRLIGLSVAKRRQQCWESQFF